MQDVTAFLIAGTDHMCPSGFQELAIAAEVRGVTDFFLPRVLLLTSRVSFVLFATTLFVWVLDRFQQYILFGLWFSVVVDCDRATFLSTRDLIFSLKAPTECPFSAAFFRWFWCLLLLFFYCWRCCNTGADAACRPVSSRFYPRTRIGNPPPSLATTWATGRRPLRVALREILMWVV